MRRWSELAERLAATTRTSEKTALLADYLRTLTAEELPIAAVFLTGRPFAEADERATGLGWSAIATTVTELGGVPRSALAEAYDRSSDLGIAVADVLRAAGHAPPPEVSPTLPEVAAAFAEIEAASGPARKSAILRTLLERVRSADRQVHRQGARRRPADRPSRGTRRGGHRPCLRPHRSMTSSGPACSSATSAGSPALARDDALDYGVARPLPSAQVHARLAGRGRRRDRRPARPGGLGRGQVRRHPGPAPQARAARCASTRATCTTSAAATRRSSTPRPPLAWDGILDGEILAWRDGTVLPFIALQARLGRKAPSAAIQAEVPVIYVAFDVLALGPGGDDPVEPLLRAPLSSAVAARLDALELPVGRRRRPVRPVAPRRGLRRRCRSRPRSSTPRARRNEGLMVKDPESVYAPGRRGLGWLKMKKALATIDCVVVGVEVGHGKRHGVLSDYTFAVRDTDTDRLVNIGKAYSGLTDAEIAEMTRWFEAHTIARFGRYHQVEPTHRGRDRVRRHRPLEAPRVGVLAALPADRPAAPRQDAPTRSTRSRPSPRCTRRLQHGAEYLVTAGRAAGRPAIVGT